MSLSVVLNYALQAADRAFTATKVLVSSPQPTGVGELCRNFLASLETGGVEKVCLYFPASWKPALILKVCRNLPGNCDLVTAVITVLFYTTASKVSVD